MRAEKKTENFIRHTVRTVIDSQISVPSVSALVKVSVARIRAGEFHPAIVARVHPRNVLLLNMRKHVRACNVLPATVPATLQHSAVRVRDAVTVAQMGREETSRDVISAARGVIHPLTCVEPVLWRRSNPDEHESVFVGEVAIEPVAVGVCRIGRHLGCVERAVSGLVEG